MSGLHTLPARDLDRLQKLAGLLGSDGDGERANAARMCTRLLGEHGLTWRDALTPSLPRPSVPPIPGSPMQSHQRTAFLCLSWAKLFNETERRFLRDACELRQVSAKQSAWLSRLHRKVIAAIQEEDAANG